MSDLDDELREALADSEQKVPSGGEAPAVSVTPTEGEKAPARNVGLLVGLLVAAGGILALVFTSVDDAAIYSVSASKLLEDSGKYAGKNVRVTGELVVGTLKRRDQPCEYRFAIQKDGEELEIHYPRCIIPDTLKDAPDVQVTAEGSLSDAGHFEATHVMAKCPSKYEMQERAQNGEAIPHSMKPSSAADGTTPGGDEMPLEAAPEPSK